MVHLIMVLQAQRMIEWGKTSLRLISAMVWANLYIISDIFWSILVPELTVFWFDRVENVYFINHDHGWYQYMFYVGYDITVARLTSRLLGWHHIWWCILCQVSVDTPFNPLIHVLKLRYQHICKTTLRSGVPGDYRTYVLAHAWCCTCKPLYSCHFMTLRCPIFLGAQPPHIHIWGAIAPPAPLLPPSLVYHKLWWARMYLRIPSLSLTTGNSIAIIKLSMCNTHLICAFLFVISYDEL